MDVYNIGLAGYLVVKGYNYTKISKQDGIKFDISQEEFKKLRNEFYNSDFKKYNDIMREIARHFKAK